MRSTKHIPRYYNTLPLRYYLLPRLSCKASSVLQAQLRKARVGLRLLLIDSEYRKIPNTPLALSMKDFVKAIMLYF
jgi:hypothetical protein